MAMSKHLLSCKERNNFNKEGNKECFLIRASAGPFFVYFEININDTLEKMDEFLRALWLDCCGHLSAFTIDETKYNSYCEDLEPDEKSMNYKLSKLICINQTFQHEYDFGTPTYLNLKVIEKIKSNSRTIEIIDQKRIYESCNL